MTTPEQVKTKVERAWTGPDDAAFKDAMRASLTMFVAWSPDQPGADIRLSCLFIGWVEGQKADQSSDKRPVTLKELRWLREACLGAMECALADGAPYGAEKQQEAGRLFGFIGHDLGFPPRWHRKSVDIQPTVVDAPLQSGAAITVENATHIETFPDGSQILVGPISLVHDDEHGACLQVQYIAAGVDDSEARRSLLKYKQLGDKKLHAIVMQLQGNLVRIRERAPKLFAVLLSESCTRSRCICTETLCEWRSED